MVNELTIQQQQFWKVLGQEPATEQEINEYIKSIDKQDVCDYLMELQSLRRIHGFSMFLYGNDRGVSIVTTTGESFKIRYK